jgi:hypothetical protein
VALGGGVLGAALGAAGGLALTRGLRGRVLVLAPDGAVVGFSTGIEVVAWASVGAFVARQGQLGVLDAQGAVRGVIDATWFTRPLALIVAVAETYRRRFSAPA